MRLAVVKTHDLTIILARTDGHLPYVTGAQRRDQDPEGEWFWGHYFSTEAEARTDLTARILRGF